MDKPNISVINAYVSQTSRIVVLFDGPTRTLLLLYCSSNVCHMLHSCEVRAHNKAKIGGDCCQNS